MHSPLPDRCKSRRGSGTTLALYKDVQHWWRTARPTLVPGPRQRGWPPSLLTSFKAEGNVLAGSDHLPLDHKVLAKG